MRKHDVRKWLHAVLDLLPVILIPVFMIYSHRHTIDSGSISVPQNIAIQFNQLKSNGNFSDGVNGYRFGANATYNLSDDYLSLLPNDVDVIGNRFMSSSNRITYYENHTYVLRFYYSYPETAGRNATFRMNTSLASYSIDQLLYSDDLTSYSKYIIFDETYELSVQFVFDGISYFNLTDINIFDLTAMFGYGNEPTLSLFNSYFVEPYYDYDIGSSQLLHVDNYVFDDTDIMSQFTYQLYNSVDKYFNMGNVFNLNGVYDWFNLNIFNGQSPIYIFIVWQIVLYEFVMDLLFLLYGLFMWFIDMIQKLMEKPLNSVK